MSSTIGGMVVEWKEGGRVKVVVPRIPDTAKESDANHHNLAKAFLELSCTVYCLYVSCSCISVTFV